MSFNSDIRLSKSLSWLLRHGAIKEGLYLSPQGYLDVDAVLGHKAFRWYQECDVLRVVQQDPKQRFKVRINHNSKCWEVKANQGHTIRHVTNADLTPITQPKYDSVIHGTFYKAWDIIKTEGLSCMARNHIHFAHGSFTVGNVKSGVRSNADIHIYVDIQQALSDGIKFFESENGVVLTPGNDKGYIETKYFIKAVEVETGYPNYTQPQDLLKVFKTFGNVHIDKCNNWSATLSYPSEQEAAQAIDANKKAHIYGYYLNIKVYSAKEKNAIEEQGRQQTAPKREFPRSKEKSIIIGPKQIDLSGDFHVQLDNILAAIRLTQEDVNKLSALYADIEGALQTIWPGCRAIPFGSITTGLGIKTSDADCFVSVPVAVPRGAVCVTRARRTLAAYPRTFAELLAIPRANTPLVKLWHVPTATACDVTFKTPLGAYNSRLLAFLLQSDPRLLPLAVLLKYWAKVHDLSGSGKLTNYALALLVVFYLQQRGVVPPVRRLQPAGAALTDGWRAALDPAAPVRPPGSDRSPISDLLGGFFQFYAKFDFDELVVCPFLGVPLRKDLFRDLALLPPEFDLYKSNVANHYVMPLRHDTSICIQDPFEQCHNVASSIFHKLALNIKAYLVFGAEAYEKEKLTGCQQFLRIILLQKPKLIQGKTHPEYRINLYPRIISAIPSPDWKAVVREVVMNIFETMLKIKLGKVEENLNPDSKKEKEKYAGTVTKSVWKKRKQFERLYAANNDLTFAEKQGKITEELINIDKQTHNTKFQLTLTYSHEPKSAVVAVKLCTGDLEQFIDFGKFVISVIHVWFLEALKTYKSNCEGTTDKIDETREKDDNQEPQPDPAEELVQMIATHNIKNKRSSDRLGFLCRQPTKTTSTDKQPVDKPTTTTSTDKQLVDKPNTTTTSTEKQPVEKPTTTTSTDKQPVDKPITTTSTDIQAVDKTTTTSTDKQIVDKPTTTTSTDKQLVDEPTKTTSTDKQPIDKPITPTSTDKQSVDKPTTTQSNNVTLTDLE